MVPIAGIGPATSPLPRECSTTEPNGLNLSQYSFTAIRHKINRQNQTTEPPMERETGIEPASLAWKARVLPLNYSRAALSTTNLTHTKSPLNPTHARQKTLPNPPCVNRLSKSIWWMGLDSNQRRRKPTDLQSAPFSHSGTHPLSERRIMPRFYDRWRRH